jgi:RNA-directed DNA polymerase
MSSTDFMKMITVSDLAVQLELTRERLLELSQRDETEAYQSFKLKKKRGGSRMLQAPDNELLGVQKIINQDLTENFLEWVGKSVHGFLPERSIVTNASVHVGQAWVLNFDLENFFGSFNQSDVRNLFVSPPYSFDAPVADLLGKLCSSSLGLPQGAPTSPMLSNWLCLELDQQLLDFSMKNNLNYSRYADDITFSSSRSIPGELLTKDFKTRAWKLGDKISQLIESYGFKINSSKTRLQTHHQKQEVTGLTVNRCVNVDRRYVRNIRGMIHAYKKYGFFAAMKFFQKYDYEQSKQIDELKRFLMVIEGRIGFVAMVKGSNNPVVVKLRQDFIKAKKTRAQLLADG